jgi:hypothetical protein
MRRILFAAVGLALSSIAAAQVMVTPQPDPAVQNRLDALMLVQAQSVDAVMDASGNYSWDYPIAFTAPPRVAYFPQNTDTSGKPIVCNWQTRTATRLTFHCDKSPGLLTTLLAPMFNPLGAAGSIVTVTARGTLVAVPPTP